MIRTAPEERSGRRAEFSLSEPWTDGFQTTTTSTTSTTVRWPQSVDRANLIKSPDNNDDTFSNNGKLVLETSTAQDS